MDAHTLTALEFDVVRRKLADEAFTDPGRRSALALEPLPDSAAARWAQDETMEMRRAAAEEGRPPVDGLTDLSKVIVAARIEGHPLDPQELLAVAASLRAARAVLSWSSRISWEHPRLDTIVGNVKAEAEAEKKISAAFDESGQVADNASAELADVRKKIGKLEDRIRRRLEDVMSATKVWLQDTFMTVRNGRFVIPVKAGARTNVPGIVHDASDSGVTVYVEPSAVVEDGNELAEVRARERAEIRRILTALSDIVRSILPAVETNQHALAALDLAAARARFAERWKCVRAEIDDRCRVRLEGARHPALLFKGIDAVPIDVRLGDDFQVLVITGPNTGGKTVALKTVGLIHLMALAGLHVPAKVGARIGFFTNVCADIGDEQSIEQSLSTFSAHLRRITELLPAANATTLVLLDELGAGTDPTEGGALGCAILEALLASGARVIATTHLGDIKTFAATTPGVVNGSVLFDVQTLRPLFTLTIGIPGQSNAFAIARRLGLVEAVVKRAEEFVGGRERALENAIGGLTAARDLAEQDRVAMGKARADAEIAEARAKQKIQDAVEEKRAAIESAAREAAEIVGRARAEVQSTLDDVKQKRVAPKEAAPPRFRASRDGAEGAPARAPGDAACARGSEARHARPPPVAGPGRHRRRGAGGEGKSHRLVRRHGHRGRPGGSRPWRGAPTRAERAARAARRGRGPPRNRPPRAARRGGAAQAGSRNRRLPARRLRNGARHPRLRAGRARAGLDGIPAETPAGESLPEREGRRGWGGRSGRHVQGLNGDGSRETGVGS
jgi:DNA mismatch repair protein MutS2